MRRIMPWRAGHPTAGLGARTAHIEPADRPPVIAMSKHGPRRPELVERHMPMHDIPADQPEFAFEVERRMDLPRDHRTLEIGCVLRDRVDDQISRRLALVVP